MSNPTGPRSFAEIVEKSIPIILALSNLALLVWRGGEISRTLVETRLMVDNHSRALEALQSGGTAGLRSHEAIQKEREIFVDSRLVKLEAAVASINEMKVVLTAIGRDMDYVTGRRKIEQQPQGSAW